MLIDTLNNLPLLKIFEYDFNVFVDDLLGTDDSLKKVRINLIELKCNLALVPIFDCCTIQKFKLFWRQVDDYDKMMLVDFLKKQRNLKDLKLNDGYGGEFFMLPGINRAFIE